jgi:hypothetical protein
MTRTTYLGDGVARMSSKHWRAVWGVQKGRRQPQATRPAGGPPPGRFRCGPPTRRRRVGMAGLGETLGSPWLPLAIRPCKSFILMQATSTFRASYLSKHSKTMSFKTVIFSPF